MDVLVGTTKVKRDAWDGMANIALAMMIAITWGPGRAPRGDDPAEWCVMPASEFMAWGLYQPTQRYLVDFGNANGHIDPKN